ncbi:MULTISPECIES: HI1506-related protein [Gammaproteobacteria]|uniref:HI1506-related protein n=1 Tax=Gammaproteobacteria TaxID=1236 RepID=UPI00289D6A60|nr:MULTISPECIES: HI1506-related protein [Gammaproteobacteria]
MAAKKGTRGVTKAPAKNADQAAAPAAPAAAEQLDTQPVAPSTNPEPTAVTPPASTEQPTSEAPGLKAGSSGQDAQPDTDQAAGDAAATTSQPASAAPQASVGDAAGAGAGGPLPYPSGVEPGADPLKVALSELQGGDTSKTKDESEVSAGGSATETVDDLELDDGEVEGLWIVAIPEQGFRRCGYRFTREGFGIAMSALTPEQIETLENEPNLKVERGIFSGRLEQLVQ